MMKIILCEDDKNHMNLNKEYIENTIRMYGEEYEIRAYESPDMIDNAAISWANILFLDIDFGYGKEDGISFAKSALALNKLLAIIFVTCYQEYTKDAFKLQAFGYLEKPVIKHELLSLVERLIKYLQAEDSSKFIEIYHNRMQIVMKVEDIIYIEKSGKKVTMFTMSRDVEATQSIASLENTLGESFLKINQGILVNKRYINRIEGDMLYTTTGETLKISRNRVKIVLGQLSR